MVFGAHGSVKLCLDVCVRVSVCIVCRVCVCVGEGRGGIVDGAVWLIEDTNPTESNDRSVQQRSVKEVYRIVDGAVVR